MAQCLNPGVVNPRYICLVDLQRENNLIMYWTVGQKTSNLILSKKDNLVISLICDERYITEHL